MLHTYTPTGICPRQISFEVEDGIVKSVNFSGGCNGNGQGIAALVEGQKVADVVSKLKDIKCQGRSTSCPAQLAKALAAAVGEK